MKLYPAYMNYIPQKQAIGKTAEEKLIYKHLLSFALDPTKKRLGFGIDECMVYLKQKGVKTTISTVEQIFTIMVTVGIIDQYYSVERKKTIYHLR